VDRTIRPEIGSGTIPIVARDPATDGNGLGVTACALLGTCAEILAQIRPKGLCQ
jgi:hypothetical protein